MLRRDFCRAAGAATGWLLIGGVPRLSFATISPNSIYLQIATAPTFAPGEIVLEIVGGVKKNSNTSLLNDGQTYYWRQTVLVDNEHVQVYHGRLTDDQLQELLSLYNDDLLPFVREASKPADDNDDDQGDDHDYGDDGGGKPRAGKAGGTGIPERFDLGQNYPNPFSGRTSIPVSVPEAGLVQLNVYDMAGRHVASLVDTVLQAGAHVVNWQASGLPSGTYTIVLKANGAGRTRLVTLIR